MTENSGFSIYLLITLLCCKDHQIDTSASNMEVINQSFDDRFAPLHPQRTRANGVAHLAFDYRVGGFRLPPLSINTIQARCGDQFCLSNALGCEQLATASDGWNEIAWVHRPSIKTLIA